MTESEKPNLMKSRQGLMPLAYPWAWEAWDMQHAIHWRHQEIDFGSDVNDYRNKVTPSEKNLIDSILLLFTESDVSVSEVYYNLYPQVFKPTEVSMMLMAFGSCETIHIAAYSALNTTLGLPDSHYAAFHEYAELKEKASYMKSFSVDNKHEIAKSLAAYGAFMEGLQLFASFAMLLNFQRTGLFKGVGQVVSWSVRDETLHALSIIRLYHTFLSENPEVDTPKLRADILEICKTSVHHEEEFINIAFAMGDVKGLTAEEMKQFVRFTADRRLVQLGLDPIYNIERNPLPWFDSAIEAPEHASFFESKVTSYQKAMTTGTWEAAFEDIVFKD